MSSTKVSIIIAVYNAQDTLSRAIASSLRQTHDNIEVIVVDDCSTDKSLTVASAYASIDKRVQVLTTCTNSGPGAARNKGVEHASGQWLTMLDADDWMAPERITTLLYVARTHCVDMVIDSYWLADEKNGQCFAARFRQLCPVYTQLDINADYFIRYGMGATKPLLNARLMRQHRHRFSDNIRFGEDMLLYSQMLLAGATCRFINKPTYFRTIVATSLSRCDRVAFLLQLLQVLTLIAEDITDSGVGSSSLATAITYRVKVTEDALIAARWKAWLLRHHQATKPPVLSLRRLARHLWYRNMRYSINAR